MASKTRLFFREKVLLSLFWSKPISLLQKCHLPMASNGLELYVIAFNNLSLIKHQHESLKKYLKDNFHYTVIDNSTEPLKREEIYQFCKREKIAYLGLPKNPYSGISASKSHGLALNWVYSRLVKKETPKYFGFLDHDIFLNGEFSIVSKLEHQPIYGHAQKRGEIWYLWPGYCFFKLKELNTNKLNFMPVLGADTGSGNFNSFYKRIDHSSLNFPSHSYLEVKNKKTNQEDRLEIIDSWIHIIGASNWDISKDKKDFKNLIKA